MHLALPRSPPLLCGAWRSTRCATRSAVVCHASSEESTSVQEALVAQLREATSRLSGHERLDATAAHGVSALEAAAAAGHEELDLLAAAAAAERDAAHAAALAALAAEGADLEAELAEQAAAAGEMKRSLAVFEADAAAARSSHTFFKQIYKPTVTGKSVVTRRQRPRPVPVFRPSTRGGVYGLAAGLVVCACAVASSSPGGLSAPQSLLAFATVSALFFRVATEAATQAKEDAADRQGRGDD